VAPDQPGIALRRFEMPAQPAIRNVSSIGWSRDSKFLVVPYAGSTAIFDLDATQMHLIPARDGASWCARATGLLPGPRIAQSCSLANGAGYVVRFPGIDGTAPEWSFPTAVGLLDLSPDGNMLALDFSMPGKVPNRPQHEVAIWSVTPRSELRRWPLPDASTYRGTFAQSGSAFCTEPYGQLVRSRQEFICRDIDTGAEILRRVLPLGVGEVRAAANRLIVDHNRILLLPFMLFGTDKITTRTDEEIWDFQTGREIASWRMDRRRSSVSPDGEMVAIGGSGEIRVYRVSPR